MDGPQQIPAKPGARSDRFWPSRQAQVPEFSPYRKERIGLLATQFESCVGRLDPEFELADNSIWPIPSGRQV